MRNRWRANVCSVLTCDPNGGREGGFGPEENYNVDLTLSRTAVIADDYSPSNISINIK